MSIEIKHTKLRNKLHTHTSFYVKIWHGDVFVRQKRLFIVNTFYSMSHQSNRYSLTWFRMSKVAYSEGFVS